MRHDPIDPAQFGGMWEETSPWPPAGTRVADYMRSMPVSSEREPVASETTVTSDTDVMDAMRTLRALGVTSVLVRDGSTVIGTFSVSDVSAGHRRR